MRFIILGSGGRENSIIRKLYSENRNYNLVCISDIINPDIIKITSEYHVLKQIYNPEKILNLLQKIYQNNQMETILIPGSEKFLEIGIVDIALKYGIPSIGPSKTLAFIETSKTFCRNYLRYNHLNEFQPSFEILYDFNENRALQIFEEYNFNFVVKADGLCGGKGVRVFDNNNVGEAIDYCRELFKQETNFLNPIKVLIEERKFGKEFSLLSFCDGENIQHMPIVQDYKDLDKDKIIKTGGMGSVILSNHSFPFLTEQDIEKCQELNKKVMQLLSRDRGNVYKGILYGGFMKTDNDVILIEYNARFGDPECINILSLLESSLGDIFRGIVSGELDKLNIKYKKENSVCVYLVPHGYPQYLTSSSFSVIQVPESKDIYLASVNSELDNNLYLNKSRSIAVCSTNQNLEECLKNIYELVSTIQGPLFYRKDIASEYLNVNKNSYQDSGVNIEEGDRVVKKIESVVSKTYQPYVLNKFGDFGCIFDIHSFIQENKFKHPVLLSSTDGVGTKTKLVLQLLGNKEGLRSLGKDIVNHSVNDILVKGGKPLFFMDYVASSKISSDDIFHLVEGISEACSENGMSLLGGETAEMPGIYMHDCYDIVGTILGVCEKSEIIDGPLNIKEGDSIFGFLSSGPHTNGYSLIRKILNDNFLEYNADTKIGGFSITELIRPHKSYLEEYKLLREKNIEISGLCHITGGGYIGNLERVLPESLGVEIDVRILEPFATIQRIGNLSDDEMYTVFNCGYGMLFFTSQDKEEVLRKTYSSYLGKVVLRDGSNQVKHI